MTAESRSVVVRLSMEAAQYIATAQKVGTVGADAMSKVEKASHRSSAALDDVGRSAGRMALGGAAALTTLAAAGIRWESDWAGVTKTVDGTVAQMDQLEGGLRGLAKTLPATHTEIAGVAEAAGQLGVAREDIVSFTKTMVDLGETTNLTAEQAATDIAQISNVMRTAPEDVDNLGASLVALGNDGASTEAQILDMAQRIAGAGAQIGLAESDILAIANAAASMGIEVEAGGSAVSRVFTSMAKATAQGGEKLEAFAQVAGVSADEFARAFEEDPARAFAAFTGGLDRINKSGGDVFTTLDQLKLSDVRVSQALLGMAASGDLLTDSLDLGARAWEENTALAIEAGKRYETTGAKTQIAWNKIKDAGIEASDVILPVVGEIADKVGTVADAFGRLPDPVQSSATQLLAVGTITSGALWLGASIIGKVTSLNSSLATLAETSPKSARGLSLVTKGVAGLTIGILAYNAAKDTFDIGIDDDDIRRQTELIAARFGPDIQGQIAATTALMEEQQAIADAAVSNADFAPGFLTLFPFSQDAADAANTAEALGKQIEELRHQQELQLVTGLRSAGAAEGNTLAFFGLADAAGAAAEEQEDVAGATSKAGRAHALTEKQVKALRDAYQDEVAAARDVAHQFFNLGESLDDSKVSLREWIHQLEQQADALANFRHNAQEAADKGLRQGLIDALEEAGPAGALRMKQLANATEEEIGRANRAWKRGQGEIDKYIDSTTKVPKELRTKVVVEDGAAIAELQRIQAFKLGDKIVHVRTSSTFGSGPGIATGGLISGPGTATSDSIPAWLSDGEYVMRAAAVNKYGTGLLHSMNAMSFARGGPVSLAAGGKASSSSQDHPFDLIWQALVDAVDNGSKKMQAAIDEFAPKLSQGIDGVRAEVQDLRSAVRDAGRKWTDAMEEQAQRLIEAARRHDIGKGLRQFDADLADGADGVRTEVRELRDSIREAGGEWTRGMASQSHRLFAVADAYDLAAQSLAQSQSTLDDVLAQQKAYAEQVGKVFNTSPFGNGGLAGFDLQTSANTNDTTAFNTALDQLSAQGLDGPLFEQLAASGDLATAMELLATGSAGIALREQAFAAMLAAQERLGGSASREVFGEAVSLAERAVALNAAATGKLEAQMVRVEAALVASVTASNDLPEKVGKNSQAGTFRGAKDALLGRDASVWAASR